MRICLLTTQDLDAVPFAADDWPCDPRPFLPDEAKAISGSVTPISADKAATAILRGVDRRRANIFTDPTTTILDRLVRMAPGITQRWLDSKVAGVAKDR